MLSLQTAPPGAPEPVATPLGAQMFLGGTVQLQPPSAMSVTVEDMLRMISLPGLIIMADKLSSSSNLSVNSPVFRDKLYND